MSAPETAPASVTSRPSRIQVMPSAATTSVWKLPQGKAVEPGGNVGVDNRRRESPACGFVMKFMPRIEAC